MRLQPKGLELIYLVTVKLVLLIRVPPGVTTLTLPEVAPVGTLVLICVLETTVNLAAVPLKLTLVAPVRLLPRITTALFTGPELGTVLTKGLRLIDSVKMVPQPMGAHEVMPPPSVVP